MAIKCFKSAWKIMLQWWLVWGNSRGGRYVAFDILYIQLYAGCIVFAVYMSPVIHYMNAWYVPLIAFSAATRYWLIKFLVGCLKNELLLHKICLFDNIFLMNIFIVYRWCLILMYWLVMIKLLPITFSVFSWI